MTVPGIQLLRMLASQAVPGIASTSPSAQAPGTIGGLDFAKLLQQARSGQLASGREVTIARGAGVSLSEDQIKRVSVAADLAEAQGATRALVMIDGMAIKLDVSMREVTGIVDLQKTGVLTGIDSVVEVPSEPSGSKADQSTSVSGAALLKKLSPGPSPKAA